MNSNMIDIIDDILLKIFPHLNTVDLINALLVCPRWATVIRTSGYLNRNFDLMIEISKSGYKVQGVFANAIYRNLTVTPANPFMKIPENAKKFIRDRNEALRNVTLKNFDREQSTEILSCLTNITKMTISNFQFRNVSSGFVDMPNLKWLELENSILFQNVIGCQSIRTLKIFGASTDTERIPNHFANELNSLLQKCSNLKELTLSILQLSNPNLKCESFVFSLEALTVENFNFDDENLAEFLLKQKESLKKLAISSLEPKKIISRTILNKLNLIKLEIDVGLIPKVFNSGATNSTINKLTIRHDQKLLKRPEPMPMERHEAHFPRPQNSVNVRPIYVERAPHPIELLLQFETFEESQRLYENHQVIEIRTRHDYRDEDEDEDEPNIFGHQIFRVELEVEPEVPIIPQNQIEAEEKTKAAEKIISACRAIESFTMVDFMFDSLLDQLYWTQTNLKILKLKTLPNTISTTVQFDKLEVIEIDQIQNTKSIENCKILVTYSPNLKTLKINSLLPVLFDSNFFIKIISKAKNLREFHIGTTCKFTSDTINALKVIKDCGRPLNVLSFENCSVDDKENEKLRNISMNNFKLNLNLSSTKFFSSMINQTQLGRMSKEIDENNKSLKQQVKWSMIRQFEFERSDYFNLVKNS